MSVIYEPKGRAAEYAHLCINLYTGCLHGCRYCYCPDVLRISPKEFSDPARIAPRKNIVRRVRKEAPKYAGTNKRVHLCFICDAYQPIEAEYRITRQVLEILRANHIPFQILTKGGKLAERDFDLYTSEDAFAVTLTCQHDDNSRKVEPLASPTSERIATLIEAHNRGIFTWVSLEPVLNADESLELIKQTCPFVRHYKIGKLNYERLPVSKRINWHDFGLRAIELCERLKVSYWIKHDLAQYLIGCKWTQTETRTLAREPMAEEGLL